MPDEPLDDGPWQATAFLPVTAPALLTPGSLAAGVRVDELPATDVAVFVDAGGYDTIDDAYRRLGA
jgi:hypothetical protein